MWSYGSSCLGQLFVGSTISTSDLHYYLDLLINVHYISAHCVKKLMCKELNENYFWRAILIRNLFNTIFSNKY